VISKLVVDAAWLGGELEFVRKDGTLLTDLVKWRVAARQAINDPRVVSLDLDERAGEIVLGVADEVATVAVKETLVRSGIPSGVVRVQVEAPSQTQASVRDKNRPRIENGFTIAFSIGGGYAADCTHGADAIISGPQYGFVTNSHCSPDLKIGTTLNHAIYQHLVGGSNLVGAELVDVPPFSGASCGPAPRVCRYSDAMFVGYLGSGGGNAYYAGKKIAETSPVGTTGTGGLNVASYRPAPFSSNVIAGLVVRKTGRATGTTEGTVTNTCLDIQVGTSSLWLLCQDRFAGFSENGDSGSPVYWGDFSNPTGSVYHVGLLWGGVTGSNVNVSPWYGITSDLGVFY
jgi:hypothetical protein